MKTTCLLTIFLLFASFNLWAQPDEPLYKIPFYKAGRSDKHDFFDESFDLKIGGTKGFFGTAEIGISRSGWYEEAPVKSFLPSRGYRVRSSYTLSCEYNFNKEKPLIIPKFSFDIFGGGNLGGSLLYATNGHKGTLYIQPRLGITFSRFASLSYGYNIPLMKNHMGTIFNSHVFSLSFILPFYYNNGMWKTVCGIAIFD